MKGGNGARAYLDSTTGFLPEKSEIRNPKSETNSNEGNSRAKTPRRRRVLDIAENLPLDLPTSADTLISE